MSDPTCKLPALAERIKAALAKAGKEADQRGARTSG